jgi:hypothetical protein
MHRGKGWIIEKELVVMKKFTVIIGTLFFMLCLAIIENRAAQHIVTTLNDGVAVTGSLRQRIAIANAGDTIVFQAGLLGTIQLIGRLTINKNLIISGPGANVITVSGQNSSQIFSITAGNVQISGLRIANGFVSGAGGGVLVDGGNLTLNNCQINANDAESGGGALVFPGSTLTITNSTINGNTSAVEGGGVSNRGGTLFLTNTTINGNSAPQSGGVSVEGGGTATILNSTISGNSASGTTLTDAGGLRIISGSTVNLKNTIVANNTASGAASPDVGGTVVSQGTNLIGNTAGGNGFIASDLLNMNPQLAALAFNGGTTPTQASMAGSPAIDAGNNTGAPATDQRGAIRPQGAAVDIGAFETGVSVTSGNTATGSNVNTAIGSVSVTFSGVTQSGTTTQIPISPSSAGTLPGGFSFGAGYPAFDITTTAIYTAPITVCVQIPGMIPMTTFNALALLHYEGGTLVDRTTIRNFSTQTICANVQSLSPFAIAEDLSPTAATVNVGGRVSASDGRAIYRARVSITNSNGETQTVLTNQFGYFRFDEIAVGETYIISVRHKIYQFNSQVVSVFEEIQNADFTAEP